jgi:hypothetical protein
MAAGGGSGAAPGAPVITRASHSAWSPCVTLLLMVATSDPTKARSATPGAIVCL